MTLDSSLNLHEEMKSTGTFSDVQNQQKENQRKIKNQKDMFQTTTIKITLKI